MFRSKAKGVALIDSVIDQFNSMIEDLDRGSSDCHSRCDDIVVTISGLNSERLFLTESSERAENIAHKLRGLIVKQEDSME